MKRRLILILGLSLLLLLFLYYHFAWPFHVVHDLDARYRTVQRDMTEQEVLTIMAHPRLVQRLATTRPFYWDDAGLEGALNEIESQRIRSAIWYTVDTFFLPIVFEFTFDEHGRVVGKHRYD